jgi:UDP-N-acetyl-D-galactosamine dehydrogenase
VRSASETLVGVLKPGDYVVYESTVYPGCTEEVCIPILEKSGLKAGVDFKVGYSPERINPGDPVHRLENTTKIVSGCDQEALEMITKVYQLIIEAPLHQAPSIKVAEAAKVIENTQRDLNIALMNELSIIFNLMGINTYDVIEAAATKWNFHRYSPGLVGGHCIGVDPYYLTYKANALGYHARVILSGREINDNMGFYVGQQVVKQMIKLGKAVRDSRLLVYGITFKENVADIRNSKVVDLISELQSFMVQVDVMDCHADPEEVKAEYNLELITAPNPPYDAIILAVPHNEYTHFQEEELLRLVKMPALFVDIKGIYKNRFQHFHYWSL